MSTSESRSAPLSRKGGTGTTNGGDPSTHSSAAGKTGRPSSAGGKILCRPSTPSSSFGSKTVGRPSTPPSSSSSCSRKIVAGDKPSTPSSATSRNISGNRTAVLRAASTSGSGLKKPQSEHSASPPAVVARPLRSPKSVDSKTKLADTPDRRSVQRLRGNSDAEEQLNLVREELEKARQKLALAESEKARILVELNAVRERVNEANEQLQEAFIAKKRAEDALEIEKFRADELEQSAIDMAQKHEEACRKELEIVNSLHASDLDAARLELEAANEAKDAAMRHADDLMKVAQANAGRMQMLVDEVVHLRALLDVNSGHPALNGDLKSGSFAMEQFTEMEKLIEALKSEADDANKTRLDALHLLDESQNKNELLEIKLEEVTFSERFKTESLATAMEKLDENISLLQDKEAEIGVLKGKLQALELEVARLKAEIDVLSSQHFDSAQGELIQGKPQSPDCAVRCLIEQESKLASELEMAKFDAREAQARFMTREAEYDGALAEISKLKTALKNSKERYEVMLDEAYYEIVCLRKSLENSESEAISCSVEMAKHEEDGANEIDRQDADARDTHILLNEDKRSLAEEQNESHGVHQEEESDDEADVEGEAVDDDVPQTCMSEEAVDVCCPEERRNGAGNGSRDTLMKKLSADREREAALAQEMVNASKGNGNADEASETMMMSRSATWSTANRRSQQQKMNKPLLKKFGSLLNKKSGRK